MLDPAWNGGNYTAPPKKGIRLFCDILGFLAARSPEMYRAQFPKHVTPAKIVLADRNRTLIHMHGGCYVLNPGEAGLPEAVLMAGFGGYCGLRRLRTANTIEAGQSYDEAGQCHPSTCIETSRRAIPVKSGAFGGPFAQAFASEVQAVGVVHEPIQNGVGHGRVGDHLVPVFDVDLTGHDRAAAPLSVIEDLQHVAALLRRHVRQPPVIQDQKLTAGDGL
jgi:hypothetical protein